MENFSSDSEKVTVSFEKSNNGKIKKVVKVFELDSDSLKSQMKMKHQ